jgi:hypothetical protein
MKDAVLQPVVINEEHRAKGRWYHVRPTLRRTLAVAILALVALVAAGDTPHSAFSAGAFSVVAKIALTYTEHVLAALAGLAVTAVVVRALHKPRTKQFQAA